MKGKFWNNSYAYPILWTLDFAWFLLAVVFSDLYRQHSFKFHIFRTIIYQFSLTLMSSMSLGDYLISGTKHTNLSQNGRNPRPAGLGQASRPTPMWFHCATPRRWSWTQDQANIKCSTQVLWVKTEMRTPSPIGPLSVTRRSVETQTDLRTNMQHMISMTEQWAAEPS